MRWWGVEWVSLSTIGDLLAWCHSWKFKGMKKLLWEAIPVTILWSIWNVRNKFIFEGVIPRWEDIIENIKIMIACSEKIKAGVANYSIEDIVYRW